MKSRKRKISIGFSRTLGLFDAVALGGCVSIGLLLVVGVLTFQTAGENTPQLFFLTLFFFLPLVLSLIERASMVSGPANFYRLIRTIGSPLLLFAGGGLILVRIIVRPVGNDKYELVDGERRFHAFKSLYDKEGQKWIGIPAIVEDMTPKEAIRRQIAINENRQDLTPFEKAKGFKLA